MAGAVQVDPDGVCRPPFKIRRAEPGQKPQLVLNSGTTDSHLPPEKQNAQRHDRGKKKCLGRMVKDVFGGLGCLGCEATKV